MPAATARPAAPGTFTFLKQGVVLPARRWRPFLQIFAVNAVLGVALLLFKLLAVAPLVKALNCGGAYSAVIRDDIHAAAAWARSARRRRVPRPLPGRLARGQGRHRLRRRRGVLRRRAPHVPVVPPRREGRPRGRRRDVRVRLRPQGGLPRRRLPPGAAGGPAAFLSHRPSYPGWLVLPSAVPVLLLGGVFYLYLDVVCAVAVDPSSRRWRSTRRRQGPAAREPWRALCSSPWGGSCRAAGRWEATTWRSWWTVASRACCTAPSGWSRRWPSRRTTWSARRARRSKTRLAVEIR
ncbi:hypothetical protein GQ55_6G090200 [Panicum hallii var. hallii]|uniref:Uncharacterized protein n=1 Tax=Panicum hallii var. hallii TaxID=1504633 RepID=A0A2T7D5G3_9POAL|nr:hypothetical protein GQ55_6G090200 [Panicum hallii var. hallii]